MEVNGSEASLTFLASHYVFIICYPIGLETVHIFRYFFIWTVKEGVVLNFFCLECMSFVMFDSQLCILC